jgi:hypothetical protein
MYLISCILVVIIIGLIILAFEYGRLKQKLFNMAVDLRLLNTRLAEAHKHLHNAHEILMEYRRKEESDGK